MKKTISILLILTMLFSMMAVAIPTGAAVTVLDEEVLLSGNSEFKQAGTPGEGVTGAGTVAEPTAPTLATGAIANIPEGGVNSLPKTTWDKPWETEPDKWTAISDYSQFAANDARHTGKQYYLTADITVTDGKASGGVSGDFILDGNGHTITIAESGRTFIACPNNVIIRNVKIDGVLEGSDSTKNMELSPIGGHNYGGRGGQSNGKVEFYNVWCDVDMTLKSTHTYAGGLIAQAAAGSVFQDVIVTGDITVDASCTTSNIGGLVGETTGAVTFTNCTYMGNVTIASGASVNKVGGIVGNAAEGTTFTNCLNKGNFSATLNGNLSKALYIGGIAGGLLGNTLTTCTSTGNITVNGNVNQWLGLGGMAGYIGNAKSTLKSCTNSGNISYAGDATSYRLIGGMTGVHNAEAAFDNCKNGGNVTVTGSGNQADGVGGITGWTNEATSYTNCIAEGTVSATTPGVGGVVGNAETTITANGTKTAAKVIATGSAQKVGGFAGYVTTLNATNCISAADVSAAVTTNSIGGFAGNAKTTNATGCISNAKVSTTAATYGVAGFVGISNEPSTYKNCTFGGTVELKSGATFLGGGFGAGGFVGSSKGNFTANNCLTTADAAVTVASTANAPHHEGGIGGFVGEMHYKAATVTDSVNRASVTVASDSDTGNYDNGVGGIVGNAFGSGAVHTFTNADNAGAITLEAGTNGWNVGGILGYWYESAAVLTNCDNGGAITVAPTNYIVSGIVGFGYNLKGGTNSITGCSNSGKITITEGTSAAWNSKAPVGLFVAGIYVTQNSQTMTITDTVNAGAIEVNGNAHADLHVAGIATNPVVNTTITKCYNSGDITVNGTVAGVGYVGGIVSATSGSGTYVVSDVHNDSDITVNTTLDSVGGIVGTVAKSISFDKDAAKVSTSAGTITTTASSKVKYVGGFFGYYSADQYSFNNLVNDLDIDANGKMNQAGGFIGFTNKGGSFTDCVNNGDVTANNVEVDGWMAIAGFVGYRNGGELTFTKCTNNGAITHDAGDATTSQVLAPAGFVGVANGNKLQFTACKNYGAIYNATEHTTNLSGMGGFTGWVNVVVEFNGCINYGTITNEGNVDTIGGFAGTLSGIQNKANETDKDHTALNSKNEGAIIVTTDRAATKVGGLVGFTQDTLDFDNSYNLATVTMTSNGGGDHNVAGILGRAGATTTFKNNTTNTGRIVINGNVDCVAGLVANAPSAVTINNAHNSGAITVNGSVSTLGGLIGWESKANTITNSTNSGNITSAGQINYGGGLIGVSTGGNSTISNCSNSGDITVNANTQTIGGIIGYAFSNTGVTMNTVTNTGDITLNGNVKTVAGIVSRTEAASTLTNVINDGDVTVVGNSAGDWVGISGLVGRKASSTAVFNNCENNGDISYTSNGNVGNYSLIGGFMGVSNSGKVTFNGSINTGDVIVDATNGDLNAAGGFAGWFNTEIEFNDCINDARIEVSGDVRNAGGFIGYFTDKPAVINNSFNMASDADHGVYSSSTYSSASAGGFVGMANNVLTITNSLNRADVEFDSNGIGNAGGIVGYVNSASKIEGCVVTGSVGGSNVAGGIVGYSTNAGAAVTDCIMVGPMVENGTNNPIATGSIITAGNYFIEGYFEGVYDQGKEINDSDELDAVMSASGVYATYGFDRLEAVTDEAEALFDDQAIYAVLSWERLINTYNEVIEVENADRDLQWVDNGDGTRRLEFLTQAEVNKAYYDMRYAIDVMALRGEKPLLLKKAIADAEAYLAANVGVAFDGEAWGTFTAALAAAQDVMARDDIQTAVDPVIIDKLANDLMAATAALEDNKGGAIYSADDFARLEGQSGNFYLMADITVTAPVDSFSGTLEGNGYTVTVAGNALFNNFAGSASDLIVAGASENNAAIFGNASGDASVSGVIITVAGFEAEALFASVADEAEVEAAHVLITGKTDAIASDDVVLKNVYAIGGEYYAASGALKTELEIAAGLAAYNINAAFGQIILVQNLGIDAHPYVGIAMPDGSNVVVLGANGTLENNVDFKVSDGKIPEFEKVPTVEIVTDMLKNAIARAEALKEADYDANSWANLQIVLANAKAALANDKITQNGLDSAASALTVAIASLDLKKVEEAPAVIDYSKLNESINSAKALNKADYTANTWAVLEAMLKAAEAAKNAPTQSAVTSAKAALDNAIARLEKVEAAPAPQAPVAEEKGCGSVVGGSAIALIAVLALGAGVAFKKKED